MSFERGANLAWSHDPFQSRVFDSFEQIVELSTAFQIFGDGIVHIKAFDLFERAIECLVLERGSAALAFALALAFAPLLLLVLCLYHAVQDAPPRFGFDALYLPGFNVEYFGIIPPSIGLY